MQTLQTLARVLDHCFEAVISVDLEGTIVYFNGAAARLFGYAPEEVAGQSLEVLVPEEVRGRHQGFIKAFNAASEESLVMGANGEIAARRKDGRRFLAEGTISKLQSGEKTFFTAILRDVSDRRDKERRIRASEEKYRAIVDNAPDAILVANARTGLIQEANAAAGELFGCPPEQLLGRHQEELHPPARRPEYRRYFRQHLEEGRLRVADGAIMRDDGTEVPVAITARPTEIAGEPVLVGFFRDVRERKRWEEELARARERAESANRAKSDFLASMSHELRTPLNGIIGFAELIEGEHVGPIGNHAYRDYASHIHSSGRYLAQTIEEILDYSRLEAGKFRLQEDVFNSVTAATECLRMVQVSADNAGVPLTLEAPADLPCLRADLHGVKQVTMNLLSNAIKFTPRGGQVTVRLGITAQGVLELVVADTGVGIPEAQQERVFERFEQGPSALLTQKKGTGIGLSLARGLMELHGGTIALESEEGRGTTVTARFPASRVVQC